MSAIKSIEQIAVEQLRLRADAARRRYKLAVRPIVLRTREGAEYFVGSANLVQMNGLPRLVTAAHVLDEAEKGSLHIAGRSRFLSLNADFTATTKVGDDRSADHADVAMTTLAGPLLEGMEGLPFIEGMDQAPGPGEGADRALLLMGYRYSQNKMPYKSDKLQLKIWTYRGQAVTPEAATKRQQGGAYNLFMDYAKKAKTLGGVTVATTSPEGVSGGAIFDLGRASDISDLGAAKANRAKLVGVFIEHDTASATLVGTRLEVLQDLL